MVKIIKNNTGADVAVNDVGVTIPASGQYQIVEQDWPLWALSTDIVTLVNAGTLTVNNGVIDYLKVPGIAYIKFEDRVRNIITVCKNPGYGDFATIAAAMASITDASSTNRYSIQVGPGIYTENNPIAIKPFAFINGIDGSLRATQIVAANANAHLFTITDSVFMSNLLLRGVSGSGFSLISIANSTSNNYTRFFNCSFGSTDTIMKVVSNSSFDTRVIVNSCIAGDNQQFNKGFLVDGSGTIPAEVTLQNLIIKELVSTYPSYIGYVINSGKLTVLAGNLHSSNALSTGSCFQFDSGGKLEIVGTQIEGFSKAIYGINSGTAPEFHGIGSHLDNNTIDLQIDHASTIGGYFGSANRSKIINASTITFQYAFQEDDYGFVSKGVTDISGFRTQQNSTTTSASTLSLLRQDPMCQVFTGTTAGQILKLPDATTLSVGHRYECWNLSNQTITIKDFGTTTIFGCAASQKTWIILQDNSTQAGTWMFEANFLGGTGGGNGCLSFGYNGTANNRWLEVIGNNPTNNTPFIIAGNKAIRAMSFSVDSTTTTTGTLYVNAVPFQSITITAGKKSTLLNLNRLLFDGDELSVQIVNGSASRPCLVVWL